MEVSLFLPLCDGLQIEQVTEGSNRLLISIGSRSPNACCPLCGEQAWRIHSHYTRRVTDLPCAGRPITLLLRVRKFFCPHPPCPRTIFAEQFPELVPSYARITNRLRDALVALGLATSAQVSERLAPKLGMSVSAPSLLRRLRAVDCPPPSSVRILGIDDWAWKKGQTYGTLFVDLELRRPIEVLADRNEETVEAWLRPHPEIEVVSRDRGGEYAAAARKGAPQAQQVADKFHILKNLRDGLKEFMARKQKWLPEVEEILSAGIPLRARGKQQEKHWRSMSKEPRWPTRGQQDQTCAPSRSQLSRDNRMARYEAVRALHQQALSEREIARRLNMSRNTVPRFLAAESFPARSPSPYRGSILDPYKPYILQRWKAGCWNGSQLYSEAKELGYTGSEALFRLFISSVRKHHQAAGTSALLSLDAAGAKVNGPSDPACKPIITRRLAPARASWLYISQSSKLDEKQRSQVEQIRAAHADLDTTYQLTQAFVSLLAEHQDTALDSWLVQAEHSGVRELKSFAQGIRRDYVAVRAAFTSEWSNGPVEAQVNCLKLQKRLMFGHANFDVLRLRVLRRA